MRNYLKNIEIVGAVLVYRGSDLYPWALNWLYNNCDRICIVLDNWDKKIETIVKKYKNKYPNRTHIGYSDIPVNEKINKISGKMRRRFKANQSKIRNCVAKELKKMHKQKPIDLLIWPDHDEVFINEFPKYLVDFWNSNKKIMSLGFIQVYDSFKVISDKKMSRHARVYKYDPLLDTARGRRKCQYYPYDRLKPYTIRDVLIHLNHITEKHRRKRAFLIGGDIDERLSAVNTKIWILPKDVRTMIVGEIASYTKNNKPILFSDFIKNKKFYYKKYVGQKN